MNERPLSSKEISSVVKTRLDKLIVNGDTSKETSNADSNEATLKKASYSRSRFLLFVHQNADAKCHSV
jgi:hypothetical protein